MLTLLIGILLGLIFLWVLFFSRRDAPLAYGEDMEDENEEVGSEPSKYDQQDEAPLHVWDWDEDKEEEY